jgi:hypothetical protein
MVIVPDEQHGALGTTKPCLECNGSGIASCCDAAGSSAEAAYRDDKFEPELCHHCGVSYRGPALYCSLTCAIADA